MWKKLVKKELTGCTIKDVSQKLYTLNPSQYPLYTIIKGTKELSNEANNPVISWFEDIEGKCKKVENLLQIISTEFNPDEKSNEKMAIEHIKEIEYALWFSKLFPPTCVLCGSCNNLYLNPNPDTPVARKTRGIFEFYEYGGQEIKKIPLQPTLKDLYDFLRDGFEYGQKEKLLFVDSRIYYYLINLLKEKKSPIKSSSAYGLSYKIWVTPFGLCSIIQHPGFANIGENPLIALIDMNTIRYRYLSNSDTHLYENLQLTSFSDLDISEEEIIKRRKALPPKNRYLTEFGLEFRNAIKNKIAICQ